MSKAGILIIVAVVIFLILLCGFTFLKKKGSKLIAFTFDDGPSKYTEALLDGLEIRSVPVTFFMNGENGTGGTCGIKNGHERLLPRMWESGHQLANHTYRHSHLGELPPEQIASEVTCVENLIFDAIGGRYECFVRTPYGQIDRDIMRNVGAPVVLWSMNLEEGKNRNPDHVFSSILSRVKRNDIILLHDIYETSVAGALRAIDVLKEQGYEFVTVAELMRRTRTDLICGKVYHKANYTVRCLAAYEAPCVEVQKCGDCDESIVTCSAKKGLSIYYTTNGFYPKLSDPVYDTAVVVKSGTIFSAIGVDKWGTRTPQVTFTIK